MGENNGVKKGGPAYLVKQLIRKRPINISFTTSQEDVMKRYNMCVVLIRSAVIVCSLILGSSSFALAEEPAGQPAPSDQSVKERAVPMQKSTFMSVPRLKETRAPIPSRGGTMNFSCGSTSCTCRGDRDCNDMFSTTVCGGSAVCDNTTGECSCLRY
jgi:hypothetical protein